jgi:predicted transporter
LALGYLSNLALFLTIKRFYVTPGCTFADVLERLMQYKPEYFKNLSTVCLLFGLYFVVQAILILIGLFWLFGIVRAHRRPKTPAMMSGMN